MALLMEIDRGPTPRSRRAGRARSLAALVFLALGALMGWRVVAKSRPRVIEAHTKRVNALAFSRSGKLLASLSWKEGTLRFWSLPEGKLVRSIEIEEDDLLTGFGFLPDESGIVAGVRDAGVVRIYPVDSKAPTRERALGVRGKTLMAAFSVSTDGRLAAALVARDTSTLEMHSADPIDPRFTKFEIDLIATRDLSSVAAIASRSLPFDTVGGPELAIAPAGDLVVESNEKGTFAFDLESRTVPWARNLPESEFVSFSPDGSLLALAGGVPAIGVGERVEDAPVTVVEVGSGKVVSSLSREMTRTPNVEGLAFSPRGDLLFEVTTSIAEPTAGEVRAISASDGKRLRTWRFAIDLSSLAVSPVGDLVAAGTQDGKIFLLNPSALLTLSR
jgi:WD40 repeat protein